MLIDIALDLEVLTDMPENVAKVFKVWEGESGFSNSEENIVRKQGQLVRSTCYFHSGYIRVGSNCLRQGFEYQDE